MLKVGDAVLFESAVICEYLDEVHPPPLHPADPLRKALNRAWMEFSSELFVDLYRMANAPEREEFESNLKEARKKLKRLEEQIGDGPFFNGSNFAVLDAAIAPAFQRISLMEEIRPLGLFDGLPKVKHWSEAVLGREAVRNSVVPEFSVLFRNYLAAGGSYLARGMGGS